MSGVTVTFPTQRKILPTKAFVILCRNATGDYLVFVAFVDALENDSVTEALEHLDALHPQPNRQSTLQQLLV